MRRIKKPSENNSFGGGVFVLSIYSLCAFFLMQSVFFGSDLRPDEVNFLADLYYRFRGNEWFLETWFLRSLVFILNVSIVLILSRLRLIDKRTMVIAFVWPLTAFLFSKLYWEFFVFPLCLVRLDLRVKSEIFFIISLIIVFFLSSENNLVVLIFFRLAVLFSKTSLRWYIPLIGVIMGFLISYLIEVKMLSSIPWVGSVFERFYWTRQVANPNYSIFETVGVFFVSFHFFTLHELRWEVDAFFSFFVISLLGYRFIRNGKRNDFYYIVLLASFILAITEITHAFQNARYYYFFIPVLSSFLVRSDVYALCGIGFLHVITKILVEAV